MFWVGIAHAGTLISAILFLFLLFLTWVASALLAPVQFADIHPVTGEPVRIQNQLTGEAMAMGERTPLAVLNAPASGRMAVITNSRRATYGYDQRLEVHGSKGMVSAGNRRATTVTVAGTEGYRREPLLQFFMQRYRDAYRLEMEAFVRTLATGGRMSPDGEDGVKALELAAAAARSTRERRPVHP